MPTSSLTLTMPALKKRLFKQRLSMYRWHLIVKLNHLSQKNLAAKLAGATLKTRKPLVQKISN